MKLDRTRAPASGQSGVQTLHLSVAGGLSQFGAYVETLSPGAWSSERHWHEAEDEFLYMLDGTATLRDDDGMQDLPAGSAVCWRHGDPNAHHITNRTTQPVRYLIVGSRAAGDICHYPDTGSVQINGDSRWQVLSADGAVLREGELPVELRDLPPVWGTPFAGPPAARVQHAADRVWQVGENKVHPVLEGSLGRYDYVSLGDAGGLSQFGAHLERLPPGSRSSYRHWHETEDEFLLILSGEVILHEDNGETRLVPGDAAAWPAGVPNAHCLENRSGTEASYLTVGTRYGGDAIHYPDHDRICYRDGSARRWTRGDGTPVAI